MARTFEVIKDIPEGWETYAQVGDILTVGRWEGELTLMKGKKSVCDIGSKFANEHCREVSP